MANRHFNLAILLLLALFIPAQAQVGTPRYNFRNRAEVEAATRRHKLNLRESYNIIFCAKRQGMIKSVVRVYEQEVTNPFDTPPELASSFALAHHVLTDSVRWDWKTDRAQGITNLTQADGIQISIYREQALKKLPKSPEVLLGYAIWAMDQRQTPKALNLVQKALRLAPKWADLHWWHARTLGSRLSAYNAMQHEKQRVRFGLLELRALDNAERLDPYFKRENFSNRSYAYYNAKRYQQALDAFDTYIRYRPDYRKYLGEGDYQQGRSGLVAAMRKSDKT